MPPFRLDAIARKADAGDRLSPDEGLQLFGHPNLTEIGALAGQFRRRFHLGDRVTYTTGIRLPWDAKDKNSDRVKRLLSALSETGGTEVVFAGALPEPWHLHDVQRAFGTVCEIFPGASLSGLAPQQVIRLAQGAGITIEEGLTSLHQSGLTAVGPFYFEPLAGRSEFTSEDGPELLGLLRAAREISLPVTLQVELAPSSGMEDRLHTLFQIRDLQALTGAIQTLVPLNTERDRNYTGSAFDYLRAVALSRLIVDNVPHVQSSWEAHDLKIAQVALEYGADDFGTVWLEWMPNSNRAVPSHEIGEVERNIREVGFTPQARNAAYEPVPAPRPSDDPPAAD